METISKVEADKGRQKPNAPKHIGNIWTKYMFSEGILKGLGVGFGANFQISFLGSIVATGQQPKEFPSYELVNAALYYTINKFRVQLNFNNILNKTHWVGGYDYLRAFPGAPNNTLATVAYTF
ncbi:MAG: TonB-dependent receptor [Saprospiraceae bacterium]|nr:TonB-dependent receptor [Saprospiraceae bacterium]